MLTISVVEGPQTVKGKLAVLFGCVRVFQIAVEPDDAATVVNPHRFILQQRSAKKHIPGYIYRGVYNTNHSQSVWFFFVNYLNVGGISIVKCNSAKPFA